MTALAPLLEAMRRHAFDPEDSGRCGTCGKVLAMEHEGRMLNLCEARSRVDGRPCQGIADRAALDAFARRGRLRSDEAFRSAMRDGTTFVESEIDDIADCVDAWLGPREAGPAKAPERVPVAWCDEDGCGWQGLVSELTPKLGARLCPRCTSSAVIEAGTPDGLTWEEYDRVFGAAGPAKEGE